LGCGATARTCKNGPGGLPLSFDALKGLHIPDQGEALGEEQETDPKPCKGGTRPLTSPQRRRPAWVRWGWTANSGRGFARTTPGYCGALNSALWNHMEKRRAAFTDEDRKRLAWQPVEEGRCFPSLRCGRG
jgi:hypothetical protein